MPAERRNDQAEKEGNGEWQGGLFGWELQDRFHHLQSFLDVVLWVGWHWLFAPHTDASLENFFGKNFGGFRIVAVFFSNPTISLSDRFLGRGMVGEASGVGDETHRNTYGLLPHRWELSRWI